MIKVDVFRVIGLWIGSDSSFFVGDYFFRVVIVGDFNGVSINKICFIMN